TEVPRDQLPFAELDRKLGHLGAERRPREGGGLMMRPRGPWVTVSSTSPRAPSSRASEMNVRRSSWPRRERTPSVSTSVRYIRRASEHRTTGMLLAVADTD